jgi:DnaJ-domain-containing protein 1
MIKAILVLLAIVGVWLLLRAAMRPKQTRALPRLSEQEARAVLGVAPDADADTIRAAHRRLAAGVHPDRGGSDELARRVNAARDLLLRDSDGR